MEVDGGATASAAAAATPSRRRWAASLRSARVGGRCCCWAVVLLVLLLFSHLSDTASAAAVGGDDSKRKDEESFDVADGQLLQRGLPGRQDEEARRSGGVVFDEMKQSDDANNDDDDDDDDDNNDDDDDVDGFVYSSSKNFFPKGAKEKDKPLGRLRVAKNGPQKYEVVWEEFDEEKDAVRQLAVAKLDQRDFPDAVAVAEIDQCVLVGKVLRAFASANERFPGRGMALRRAALDFVKANGGRDDAEQQRTTAAAAAAASLRSRSGGRTKAVSQSAMIGTVAVSAFLLVFVSPSVAWPQKRNNNRRPKAHQHIARRAATRQRSMRRRGHLQRVRRKVDKRSTGFVGCDCFQFVKVNAEWWYCDRGVSFPYDKIRKYVKKKVKLACGGVEDFGIFGSSDCYGVSYNPGRRFTQYTTSCGSHGTVYLFPIGEPGHIATVSVGVEPPTRQRCLMCLSSSYPPSQRADRTRHEQRIRKDCTPLYLNNATHQVSSTTTTPFHQVSSTITTPSHQVNSTTTTPSHQSSSASDWLPFLSIPFGLSAIGLFAIVVCCYKRVLCFRDCGPRQTTTPKELMPRGGGKKKGNSSSGQAVDEAVPLGMLALEEVYDDCKETSEELLATGAGPSSSSSSSPLIAMATAMFSLSAFLFLFLVKRWRTKQRGGHSAAGRRLQQQQWLKT